jgi:hypothetical protein
MKKHKIVTVARRILEAGLNAPHDNLSVGNFAAEPRDFCKSRTFSLLHALINSRSFGWFPKGIAILLCQAFTGISIKTIRTPEDDKLMQPELLPV